MTLHKCSQLQAAFIGVNKKFPGIFPLSSSFEMWTAKLRHSRKKGAKTSIMIRIINYIPHDNCNSRSQLIWMSIHTDWTQPEEKSIKKSLAEIETWRERNARHFFSLYFLCLSFALICSALSCIKKYMRARARDMRAWFSIEFETRIDSRSKQCITCTRLITFDQKHILQTINMIFSLRTFQAEKYAQNKI